MRKFFEIGGLVAAAVLIAFGVTAIAMGINGRSTVRDSLKLEQIVGSPDMTPSAIAAEAKKAGLPASIALPTTDIAGQPINTGSRARAFATYMRIHTLEATGGVPYAQMPRFATADGKGTSDATKALQANGRPVDNAARNLWVTETALTTALNTSYMAEQLPNNMSAADQCGVGPDGNAKLAEFECGFTEDCQRLCNFVRCLQP